MKTLIVLLLTVILIIQVSSYLIKGHTEPAISQIIISQSQRINLQKRMIPLFENVCESSNDANIGKLAEEFKMETEDYSLPQAVTKFLEIKSRGLLAKETIFTEYDVYHMNELQTMYEVLYSANNFDIFYKTAAWARQNLNCGLYVNAMYMALQDRDDTQQLNIPAPYELLPNYFIEKNVFKDVSSIIEGNNIILPENIRFVSNSYVINANYTALFYNNEHDSKLAYFREDIGLNSYYYLRKLRIASRLNNNINSNVGENMYQMMKQFMARYNLERYANGLPEIYGINWNTTIDVPYDPMLIYSDGNEFGHRTLPLKSPEGNDLLTLQSIENNLTLIVNHLIQRDYNKTQILNHLMELLVINESSYEVLARKHLAKDQNSNGYPSVLDHYMTSFRDPIFWNINKRIVDLIDEALKILPPYTKNELYLPGIEIVSVDVKKLITAYDYFEFDASEALKAENMNSTFRIKIGQPRLNHKKFSIKINISSKLMQKGIMKMYLAPMFMPNELVEKKNLFTLLDVTEINLKIGSNTITRSSDNMKHFSEDFTSLNMIKNKIEDSEFGLDFLPVKTIQSQVGYPLRLILPKGTPQGLPLQIFVFVAPYFKANIINSFTGHTLELNTAALSPGYPLDLMITDPKLFELPNAIIKYVNVLQKSDSKVENYGGPGVTKSWYSDNSYDSSSQPNYNPEYEKYKAKNYYSLKTNDFKNDNNNVLANENLEVDYMNDLKSDSLILKASKLDYTRKSMDPFDYKAKKAQFGNKNVNYDKYRSKPDDKIISASEQPLSSYKNEMDMVLNTNQEVEDNILEKIENLNDKETNERLLKAELLPSPAMLTKNSEEVEDIDYTMKKKERDLKVKMIKAELDKLIKDAKKKRYNGKRVRVNAKLEESINTSTPLSFEIKKNDFEDTTAQKILEDYENGCKPLVIRK